jgi:hypothetical protein
MAVFKALRSCHRLSRERLHDDIAVSLQAPRVGPACFVVYADDVAGGVILESFNVTVTGEKCSEVHNHQNFLHTFTHSLNTPTASAIDVMSCTSLACGRLTFNI